MSELKILYLETLKNLNNLKDAVSHQFDMICEQIAELEEQDVDEVRGDWWDERDSREYEVDQLQMLLDELEELNIQ